MTAVLVTGDWTDVMHRIDRVDGLVANAGITWRARLGDLDPADLARVQDALGRTGTVDDVVPLVAFLLSDAAAYISGVEIPVDGGMTAHGGVKSISEAMKGSPCSSTSPATTPGASGSSPRSTAAG